jgi:hypothetical protein
MQHLARSESHLALGTVALCLLALLVPAMPQDQAYHHFADARTLWGVPRALDVLSNFGFVVLGLYGLVLLSCDRLAFFSMALKASAVVFFAGFVLTGAGSSYYHVSPTDAGLVWDLLGMAIAFAGVLGMAATQRISDRAGAGMLIVTLLAGPMSVAWWHFHGSVSPYAVLQFGGMLTAALCLLAPSRGAGPQWVYLLVAYTLAKVAESLDAPVFELTGHLVSGHTLKHLLAALPALAVILPLRKPKARGARLGRFGRRLRWHKG